MEVDGNDLYEYNNGIWVGEDKREIVLKDLQYDWSKNWLLLSSNPIVPKLMEKTLLKDEGSALKSLRGAFSGWPLGKDMAICGGRVLSELFPFQTSDIDIYLTGEDRFRSAVQLYKFCNDGTSKIWSRRTDFAITLMRHGSSPVQIVLMKGSTLREILASFDLDCCAVAFFNGTLWALKRALISIATGVIPVRMEFATASIDHRLTKYKNRGFDIAIPRNEVGNWEEVSLDYLSKRKGLGSVVLGESGVDAYSNYEYAFKNAHLAITRYFYHLWSRTRKGLPVREVFGLSIGDVWEGIQILRPAELKRLNLVDSGSDSEDDNPESYSTTTDASDYINEETEKKPLAPPFSLTAKDMMKFGAERMSEFQKKNWFCKKGGLAPSTAGGELIRFKKNVACRIDPKWVVKSDRGCMVIADNAPEALKALMKKCCGNRDEDAKDGASSSSSSSSSSSE